MNDALDPTNENMSSPEMEFERVLRPKAFEDFTGQKKVLDNLAIFVQAALRREEALDHAMQYARDLPREKADQFVGMYVNNWTREYNQTSIRAVTQILEKAHDLKIIPKKIEPEFTS